MVSPQILRHFRFSLNRPLGRFSHRVVMSVCLSVCLSVCVCDCKTPTSGGQRHSWLKGLSLILACNDTISIFCCFNDLTLFLTSWCFWNHPNVERPTVSQPTVDNGEVRKSPPPPFPPPLIVFDPFPKKCGPPKKNVKHRFKADHCNYPKKKPNIFGNYAHKQG